MSIIRQPKTRALTLIEVIVVAVIVGLLAALLTPVFVGAIMAAKEIQAASNLRQIFIATDLYRTDYDGQGKYGTAYEMGLPDYTVVYDTYGIYPGTILTDMLPGTGGLWSSPCGTHPDNLDFSNTDLCWNPESFPDNLWADYARSREGSAILISDDNCNPHNHPLTAEFFPKKFIGVSISGSIRIDITTGPDHGFIYWANH